MIKAVAWAEFKRQLPDCEPDCLPLVRPDGSLLTLAEIEEAAIDHALIRCGSVTQAARSLGIPRSTSYRRLHALYPTAYPTACFPDPIRGMAA